jgi:hypothetical protein
MNDDLHNPLSPKAGDFPPQCPEGAKCTPKIGFTSVKQWTARCPSGSYGLSQTATGSGTSTISQQDADEKALEDAKANAEHQLKCSAVPIGARQMMRYFAR